MAPQNLGRMLASSPTHHGSYPVTESLALPPEKGVQHVSNPISYTTLSDVPQGNEADACEGSGRPHDALHRLLSARSNESD
jgi:hypothetical protein